jgi:hypothetical protein
MWGKDSKVGLQEQSGHAAVSLEACIGLLALADLSTRQQSPCQFRAKIKVSSNKSWSANVFCILSKTRDQNEGL